MMARKAGLPGSYIKRARKMLPRAKMGTVMKKAWSLFRGKKKKKTSRPAKTTKSRAKRPKKKGGGRMARRKNKKTRTKTVPLAPLVGFFGPLLAAKYGGTGIPEHIMRGDWAGVAKDASVLTIGFDPTIGRWMPQRAWATQGLLAGLLIHKVAGWLGQGRIFGNMPSPLNKLRI